MKTKLTQSFDYNVLTSAIANAALSRRAALQMELAVAMIHFTQEKGQTDASGKANLKAVYHAAGYLCMTKADRDYKTVNRRLNAMAKCFDKIGSSVANGWVNGHGDTESTLQYVVAEMAPFGFETLDDVLAYVGVETNRTRAPRQPAAPVAVTVTAPAPAPEEIAPVAVPVGEYMDNMVAELTGTLHADEIRELCARLLVAAAGMETPALKAA